jgi:hypothetical protein
VKMFLPIVARRATGPHECHKKKRDEAGQVNVA